MSSLTTCDPGDIYSTLSECQKSKIRCSIIGLSAEVFICKKIAQDLEGTYAVILDELHFSELLNKNAFPLPNKVWIIEHRKRFH
jgi:transcription initiation factor TFIIH subunit 2